jgi:hypothetical protein
VNRVVGEARDPNAQFVWIYENGDEGKLSTPGMRPKPGCSKTTLKAWCSSAGAVRDYQPVARNYTACRLLSNDGMC